MRKEEGEEMHLEHCKKCNQETNHNKEGECLKCKKNIKDNKLETWMNIFEGYDNSENCIQKSMDLSVLEQKDIFKLFEELKKLRKENDELQGQIDNLNFDYGHCRE